MKFPEKYQSLSENSFVQGNYRIVPIRYEDRLKIMEWRNEQIYHLRQSELLTEADQENYFTNTIAQLFDQDKPEQLLFSYLFNEECIGYGGLVHINWIDKNAEISFIMKTELEKQEFERHWTIFLTLIEAVAFIELRFNKIYTYAFDIRPHLYEVLEKSGLIREAVLRQHCIFDGVYKDVVIHSKIDQKISVRIIDISDEELLFKWANDPLNRENSFNNQLIPWETHVEWFSSKLKDRNAHYLICEFQNKPAGFIRFDYDLKLEAYIVGITIDKNYRGKKLSIPFLKKSCESLLKRTNAKIFAYIKKENIPSIKAFEGAKFKLYSTEIINNKESQKYVYEN